MKKTAYYALLLMLFLIQKLSVAQQIPVNCDLAVPGCSTPGFVVNGINPSYNVQDFGSSSVSNPSTNPQGVNSGCLLTGETVSTFISITVVTSGTLEWSLIGLNAQGNPSNSGCFDWIMWPNVDGNACAGINGNTLPPVACNWNGTCNGNTGMSAPGNYPPNASGSSYQPPLNVTAGDQFILCLSNYSYTNQNVNLDFFGTADVTCEPSTPDQTICQGSSATVNVLTFGLTDPTYNWLVTAGVSDPASGENVTVTPSVTTEYVVEITSYEGVFLDTFVITVVPPPAPDAGQDTILCQGQVISLNGTAASSSTVNWTVNTTGISPTPTVNFQPNASSISPNVTVNQPGTYTFTLTEDDGVCPPVSDQVQVQVSTTSHTTTWIGPSCAGMEDGSITIANPDAVEYSFDGGQTWVTNATQSGFGVGTYAVRSRNGYGCVFSSNVTITEPDQLYIFASNDTLICQNGSADLKAWVSAYGLAVDYHWSHTGSTSDTAPLGPLTSSQLVTVYAEGPGGCLSDTAEINVSVRPVLSGNITPYDTICPGYPTTVSVSGLNGGFPPYTITWSSGETATDVTAMEITANPPQTTVYTVTITDACETTPLVLATQVYVAPVPIPLMSVVEPVLCEPAVFEVHNETDPAMTDGYVWYFPISQSAINEPVIFTDTLMEGKYNVQLIVTSPLGCIDSVTMHDFLTVMPKPKANFSWSPNPVLMFNTEVHFQNLSFLDVEYEWSFPGGVPGYSNLERPKVSYPDGETGIYPVTLIVTSELGCKDTLTQPLIVYPEVALYAPNTFTPDGDEYNQTWKVHMDGVDIYSFHLLIFNRWGEMVFESRDMDVPWNGRYNGKPVPSGSYTWTISAKDRLNDSKYEWNGTLNILR